MVYSIVGVQPFTFQLDETILLLQYALNKSETSWTEVALEILEVKSIV